MHLPQGNLPGFWQRFAQGNASRGGNESSISESAIAFPRAEAESKPSGSFDLMREVNICSAGKEGSLELAMA